MNKKEKLEARLYFIGIAIISVILGSMLFFIFVAKTYELFQVLLSIIVGLLAGFIIFLYILFLKNKKGNILSFVVLITQFVLIYLDLFLFDKRNVFIGYTIVFLASVIYLISTCIRKIVFNKNILLLDSVMLIIITSFSMFFTSINLSKLIYMDDSFLDSILLVAVILAFISIVLYIIFKKDRSDKKKYFGVMASLFFGVLIGLTFLSYMIIQNVNYMFDDSNGEIKTFEIVDMNSENGRKGTRKYIITVVIDGNEEDFSIPSYVYHQYEINENINFELHSGFLGYEYFEYIITD